MVSKNRNTSKKKTALAIFGLMLLSLGMASPVAIGASNYASAQGLLEGLEREQSDEAVPGAQPADTGAAPLNATTVEAGGNATNATMTGGAGNATNATMTGGAGNATNATMTGGAGNATSTDDGGTTGDNQTVGGPLDVITNPIQDLFGGGGGQ